MKSEEYELEYQRFKRGYVLADNIKGRWTIEFYPNTRKELRGLYNEVIDALDDLGMVYGILQQRKKPAICYAWDADEIKAVAQ